MELILARHAENLLISAGQNVVQELIEGSGLTPKGQKQSSELALHLHQLPTTKKSSIFTSPAVRCVSTATQLSKDLNLDLIKELKISDRFLGERSFTSLDDYREWQFHSWQEPKESKDGSETLFAMKRRVKSWLKSLMASGLDRAIVVTHGSVIECITSILLGVPTKAMAKSFIECGHGNYHQWSISQIGELAVLLRANISPSHSIFSMTDPYKKISDRISSAKQGEIFVVDKYYVR
ncbi:histidine phosphatase family protein [Citrobacter portucalensis]|uniref:histidine phosphatase family protein n=1 Tax=Citrobacter portucalensis TaxID=1639133 RepID=UPI000C2212E0|nr:histidine phosphatase family protein [Citrobacter portucalensis]ATX91777.1 hypothetical protein AM348_09155 [Citrobacter freundii]AVD78156.1 hypothetical protein AM350_10965 [Citrobacter freundii]